MRRLVLLIVGGCLVLLLYAFHRRETPLLHFGGLLVGWAVVSALAWWPGWNRPRAQP